jgi:hypothetical protein
MKKFGIIVFMFFLVFGISSHAYSLTIGYTIELSGRENVPTIKLINDSDSALITSFKITIGDTGYNFDLIENIVLGSVASYTLDSPDLRNSYTRSDYVYFDSFTGFDPGEVFQFDADVDIDSANTTEDYRYTLFDLGGSDDTDNSLITVTFSDNTVLSGNLPDFGNSYVAAFYTFSQSTSSTSPVPEPATMLLLGSGLVGLAGFRRKFKKA